METNVIIEELKARATLDWNPEQKAYFVKMAEDARPVQCVRMRDVFTPDQLQFIFKTIGYRTHQKQCYKNASDLVNAVEWMATHYDSSVPGVKYVEGFAYSCGLLPIEHAFVKVGDKYIDPTFERALKLNPATEMYVALKEFDCRAMSQLQVETGYYGELYMYDYMKHHNARLAAQIRARNPHNQK